MRLSSLSPATLGWLLGGVLVAFFLWLMAGVGRVETELPGRDALAIERSDPRAGDVVVHFPRIGYGVKRQG